MSPIYRSVLPAEKLGHATLTPEQREIVGLAIDSLQSAMEGISTIWLDVPLDTHEHELMEDVRRAIDSTITAIWDYQ